MKASSMQAIAALSILLVTLSSLTVSSSALRKRQLQADEKRLEVEPRIVGGEDAYQGQFPFFGRWGGCGASLISSDFMLSAAHCNPQEGNGIRLSAYQHKNDGINVTIMERFPHPNSTDDGLFWDYLLLQLDKPVNVTPVTLNSQASVPQEDDILTVLGLGWLSYESASNPGNSPAYLQVVNVPVQSHEYCNDAYGDIDDNTKLCAGDSQYDSCVGDSGGPLITSSGEQVGIVSYGDGCAKEGKPGVYARVSYVIPWIHETICANSADPPSYCSASSEPSPNPSQDPTPSPTQKPTVTPTPNPTSRAYRFFMDHGLF
jgi:V8-like Glu-specific endopeptidase